jgi:hypothetical protein
MKSGPCSLTASIMAAVALAGIPMSVAAPIPICVVIRDHAGVPHAVLGQAIQIVGDAYRPLGIGIVWLESPSPTTDMTTMQLSILPRTATRNGRDGIIGIDAPAGLEQHVHLAHILYRRAGDDRATGHALGYVMAHLIAGMLQSAEVNAVPTIIYGDRRIAQRLIDGTALFTAGEMQAILKGTASLGR